jgi:hypothetical protein
MIINRHNYEEYFILYLDNELDSEKRQLVEQFAQQNPDLKAELDILMQSKLSPDDTINFAGKEALMIQSNGDFDINKYEERLISYIDNELNSEERKQVEKFANANPLIHAELQVLQRTKLQPETITFPDKASLYREEQKTRVVGMRWWRIAAAAVLLLGISTTAIVLVNRKDDNGIVANNGGSKQAQQKATDENNNEAAKKSLNDTKENPTEKVPSINGNRTEQLAIANHDRKVEIVKENKTQHQEEAQQQPEVVKARDNGLPIPAKDHPIFKEEIVMKDPNEENTLTKTKGTKVNIDVTSKPPKTSDNPEASGVVADNPDAIYASADENSGKKNKLRGFFRKVTRTFEKRTNIKATNDDDDRLLIAGLAIKLN